MTRDRGKEPAAVLAPSGCFVIAPNRLGTVLTTLFQDERKVFAAVRPSLACRVLDGQREKEICQPVSLAKDLFLSGEFCVATVTARVRCVQHSSRGFDERLQIISVPTISREISIQEFPYAFSQEKEYLYWNIKV